MLQVHLLNWDSCAGNTLQAMVGDSLELVSPDNREADWYCLIPVRGHHGNMNPGGAPMGIGVDTLGYTTWQIVEGQTSITIVLQSDGAFPAPGTFYISCNPTEDLLHDTVYCHEPIHIRFSHQIMQVVVRPGNQYIDYLFEMINTPFLMAPRMTPDGYHQADYRLGCDCAGLAVYGARRMGLSVPYAGPTGILEYLTPVIRGDFLPDSSENPVVYKTENELTIPIGEGGLVAGDIIHFGSQVSIFLEDRGVEGLLDPQDLLIQSWFEGTHICPLHENGFYNLPLRTYRFSFLENSFQ